uniref:Uncharacterized protein n=1 Tax=Ciona savignyi TaxID=51511 RepID=H2ZJB1_CIOSA
MGGGHCSDTSCLCPSNFNKTVCQNNCSIPNNLNFSSHQDVGKYLNLSIQCSYNRVVVRMRKCAINELTNGGMVKLVDPNNPMFTSQPTNQRCLPIFSNSTATISANHGECGGMAQVDDTKHTGIQVCHCLHLQH